MQFVAAVGHQQRHPFAMDRPQEGRRGGQCVRVRPVDVLEHDEHRRPCGEARQQVEQRIMDASLYPAVLGGCGITGPQLRHQPTQVDRGRARERHRLGPADVANPGSQELREWTEGQAALTDVHAATDEHLPA